LLLRTVAVMGEIEKDGRLRGCVEAYPVRFPLANRRQERLVMDAFDRAAKALVFDLMGKAHPGNKALAVHVTYWLKQCAFDVFSRLPPGQKNRLRSRFLLFSIRPYKQEAALTFPYLLSKDSVPLVGLHHGISLPFDYNQETFYIPVDANARIRIDFLNHRIELQGCIKNIKQALKQGRGPGSLLLRAYREKIDHKEIIEDIRDDLDPTGLLYIPTARLEQRFKAIRARAFA